MVKPISPAEARDKQITSIPDEIIEAANELLAMKWRGRGYATVKQDEIMKLALEKINAAGKDITQQDIYANGWMDIEPVFEKEGWKVEYDKPAYCESYDAYFKFSNNAKEQA